MIDQLFNDFLEGWGEQRMNLIEEMNENREINRQFRAENNLTIQDQLYIDNQIHVQVAGNPIGDILTQQLPQQLIRQAFISEDDYKVQGSVSTGNIAEIPWICVFDREITTSAQSGYYIVYLIEADNSGFYLSLNQGWTQYENAFRPRENAIQHILDNASKLKKVLKGTTGFNFEPISLNGESQLAEGYQFGNVCSKHYSVNALPTTGELVNDLRFLLGVYRQLKDIVGTDIFNIRLVVEEEEYQDNSQTGEDVDIPEGEIPRQDQNEGTSSSSWKRNPKMALKALQKAEYKCENDKSHKTFIAANSNHQFIEAHHLIPMGFQGEFDVSIDVPENIIGLCPNCHRMFHNSTEEAKLGLVRKFFDFRAESLISRRISIDIAMLESFYKG